MFLTASKLKLFTSPPQTGQHLTEAYSIPGIRMSIAYLAAPVTFTGTSRFGCSVPISVHLSTALILIFDGSGNWIWAALTATAPYVVFRFDLACVMTLSFATSSE